MWAASFWCMPPPSLFVRASGYHWAGYTELLGLDLLPMSGRDYLMWYGPTGRR